MAEIATKTTPRRITIKKRDDFDGYGNAVLCRRIFIYFYVQRQENEFDSLL